MNVSVLFYFYYPLYIVRCEFILQKLGPERVKSLYEQNPNLNRPEISNAVDFAAGLQLLQEMKNARQNTGIMQYFLNMEIVKQVVNMGFGIDVVERMVLR